MSRPITLPEPWAALARALGGVGELADACHIDTRTLHRWAHKTTRPNFVTRAHVDALARRRDLPPPFGD